MKSLAEIISNATDMAGGTNTMVELPANAATLYVLNVLADMEQENSSSARGRSNYKFRKRFNPSSRTGTIAFLPTFIRFRAGLSGYDILEIVTDIEDLTQATSENRRAILFYADADFYRYELSFDIDFDFEAELWSNSSAVDFETLEETSSVPEEFAHLVASRAAILLLDDLLLTENASKLQNFIAARKTTLFGRLRNLEHRWTVYRTGADNSQADAQTRPYDPFADGEYGEVFE